MIARGLPPSSAVDAEVDALIQVLHETEERLEELTAGEVDSVANSSGRMLLLGHAQDKLRLSQAAKQIAILNALPAHVALLDTEGRIVSVNDAWLQFAHLGMDLCSRSPIGLSYLDVCDGVQGEDSYGARRAAMGVRSVLSGAARSFSMEYPCRLSTERRWFLMRVAPLAVEPPAGVVVMHMDVTAERQVEEHLRVSESRFRQMADNIEDVFFLHDARGDRMLYVSPAYEHIWGRTCESLYEHPESWTESIHPEDRAATRRLVRAGMRDGTFTAEYRIVRPDGASRWVQSRGFPVRNSSGAVVRIAGVARDISERRQTLALLEENRQRLALATDSARIGIWDWDVPADHMAWDTRMYALYGILGAQPWRAGETWQAGLHPDDRRGVETQIAAALAGTGDFHTEFRVLWPNGEVRYLEAHAAVLRDEGGAARRMIGVNWDITKRTLGEIRVRSLNRMYAMLSGINALIVRVRSREELFDEACRIAVDEGGFRMSLICILDRNTQLVVPAASAAMGDDVLAAITDLLKSRELTSDTLVAQAVRQKVALVANDSVRDPKALLGTWHAQAGIQSIAVIPFIVGDEAVGVLVLYAREKEFFHDEEMKLLIGLAGDIAFAIDSIEKQEKLDYLAYYDALTGLANSTLFLDRVALYMRSALAGGQRMALCLIDIERFKSINDSLGRPAGDALLRQVAEWLTYSSGDATRVARIGADHFAMVLPQSGESGDVARLIERTMVAFQEHPFRLGDAVFRVSAKVGMALYPDDGISADALFKNAEAALKKAKAKGDRFLFYTQAMTDAVAGRLELENRLRQAIDEEQFVVYYQPKLNLASGEVTGAEALLRWNDPVNGLALPGDFIPILEETGLILEVGAWVMRKAIEDYRRWRSAGLPAVPIAVNVSPLQLRHWQFLADVERAIDHDGQSAACLELEITESLIMEDVKHTIATLQAIRAMGIRVAIDDFGTGFSSLSYLSKLPVDSLKIDRSFIVEMSGGPGGLALVQTIIHLAHALKLTVVAEGVESEEQSRLLRLLGCDELQGNLFCAAVPCAVFEERYLPNASTAPD